MHVCVAEEVCRMQVKGKICRGFEHYKFIKGGGDLKVVLAMVMFFNIFGKFTVSCAFTL